MISQIEKGPTNFQKAVETGQSGRNGANSKEVFTSLVILRILGFFEIVIKRNQKEDFKG